MPDDYQKPDPFKPQQPRIPGVPGPQSEGETTEDPILPPEPEPKRSFLPPLWIVLCLLGALIAGMGIVWRSYSSRVPVTSSPAQAANPRPSTQTALPAEDLPMAPGEVATTSELAKSWSSQKFIFRNPATGENVTAMVVHLPGGQYWGFSLSEPYGDCTLEYVTDLQKLQSDYGFQANHPMVGDPCNHAVFDLTAYGNGPNGLVRGQIVQGQPARPPIAIEIQIRAGKVLAMRME